MILCFISCVACTIMSFKFKHTIIKDEKIKPISLKEYGKQLKGSFKFFMKSRRIKSLIILNALFIGLLYGIVNLRSSMLSEMQVPEQYFGIVFAILQMIAAVTSRKADKIQKELKNKTLTYLCLPVAVSCILIGFIGKEQFSNSALILIFLLYLVQYAIKGPYMSLMTRYLNNFTNRGIRPKITALKNLSANLLTACISLICAFMLSFTTTANTFIIVGCITTIAIVLILDYMRDKVGLKPEQYSKEDMKYSNK